MGFKLTSRRVIESSVGIVLFLALWEEWKDSQEKRAAEAVTACMARDTGWRP